MSKTRVLIPKKLFEAICTSVKVEGDTITGTLRSTLVDDAPTTKKRKR